MKVDWHELTPQEKKAGMRTVRAYIKAAEALESAGDRQWLSMTKSLTKHG